LPQHIVRSLKPKSPEHYLELSGSHLIPESIAVNDLPLEFMMNHLRLKTGFTLATFTAATGLTIDALEPALSDCLQQKLMIRQDEHYVCSEQGWNFLDSILAKFMR
jgi:oxygen-independent coproporphyrinogen-3 oxidase